MAVTHEETTRGAVRHFFAFAEPELDLDDICLEVHAGEAEVSRALAHRVRQITVVDSSLDALTEGKRLADREAQTNLIFQRGDAAALPQLNRTFTLVLCHDALGTDENPEAVVRELVRVSRPGAAILLADSRLGVEELSGLLSGAGAEVKRTDTAEGHAYVEAFAP
ncbi:class I SAM-dependent methyltransferase [Actinocorallia sp. B10E7]|uniref:class I SAM-dependent methyltransferase n=1 Tax=Actinocorallia sp. B10E7 TaxID=3153558 RepID=UPI00325ECFCD